MADLSDSEDASNAASEEVSKRDVQIASMDRDFSSYTHDGNFSVYFKLIHNRREAEEDIRVDTFFPDFVHQFFVDSERIFGYKKPVLRFFYTASRLKRYVKFDYEDKLTRERDGIEADDVMRYLSPVLEDMEYTQDLNQFLSEVESVDEKEFRPPGNLLHEFSCPYKKPAMLSRAQLEQLEMAGECRVNSKPKINGTQSTTQNGTSNGQISDTQPSTSTNSTLATNEADNTSPCTKQYQIYHANVDSKGFGQYQARMQSLIMWFIESATKVDYEDPRWDFFMIFEKFNPTTSHDPQATPVSTEDRYFFAGYATVYRYYAYPDRSRPRVSQMLLLSPYRRNGLGTTLLQVIYDYYKKQPATLDITAEDPDEEFIAMRDFLDCRNCLFLPMFQPDRLKRGWSDEIAKEAQDKLRLCQRQSRKVYEILKLMNTDMSNEEESRKYRLEIKSRLNIPHQRLKLDCDKVEKLGYELPEEMRIQRDNQKLAAASLEENYQELVRQYQHTIVKLNQYRAR